MRYLKEYYKFLYKLRALLLLLKNIIIERWIVKPVEGVDATESRCLYGRTRRAKTYPCIIRKSEERCVCGAVQLLLLLIFFFLTHHRLRCFFLLTINPHDLCNYSRPRYTVVPGGRRCSGGDIGAWAGILPTHIHSHCIYVYI